MVELKNNGLHQFRVFAPNAGSVRLLGDFTNWHERPVAMTAKDGWWEASLSLNPGDHHFRYLVDEVSWLPDYAASGVVISRHGGWVSQLHVA